MIDFRKDDIGQTARLGRGTQPAYELIREHVPFLEKDAIMYSYIEAIRQLITSGELVDVVNRVVLHTSEQGKPSNSKNPVASSPV